MTADKKADAALAGVVQAAEVPASRQNTLGRVSLLGAGPGDPGLITRKALDRLREADLVLHDALVHPSLLAEMRPEAEARYVGKRAGRRSARQHHINTLMIEAARAGKNVARLKGGDPFLFGRGSEEAEALAAAAIPFEVVPGVPSPIAATAYAGISLTHRDLASSVAYVTATESIDKDRSSHRWAHLATATGTLVIFMGMRKLASLMALLIEHGRDPHTPAAVIHAASLPSQKTVVATVGTLASAAKGLGLPSLIVVGEVVALREHLRWFDNTPLFGQRVLVPRAATQNAQVGGLLRALGADPILCPALRTLPPTDPAHLVDAVSTLASFDWVVWTSVNAVSATFEELSRQGKDARAFAGARLAVIGDATSRDLDTHGLTADLVPASGAQHGEGLLEALLAKTTTPSRFLLPRAQDARALLPEGLKAAGHHVTVAPAYQTAGPSPEGQRALSEALAQTSAVLVSSPSTARHLHACDPSALRANALISIGPVTSRAIEALGYPVAAEAESPTMTQLVDALLQHLRLSKSETQP